MIKIKHFEELTTRELYEILKLRSEVFIVEQGGRYQDPDGIDCCSIHIFSEDGTGSVTGCIRIFPKEDEPGTVQLGRLVIRDRKQGNGRRLMDLAAKTAEEQYGAKKLFLTGRSDALGFYEKCGYSLLCPKIETPGGGYYMLQKVL